MGLCLERAHWAVIELGELMRGGVLMGSASSQGTPGGSVLPSLPFTPPLHHVRTQPSAHEAGSHQTPDPQHLDPGLPSLCSCKEWVPVAPAAQSTGLCVQSKLSRTTGNR